LLVLQGTSEHVDSHAAPLRDGSQVKYLFEFDASAAGQVASSVHRILEREPRLKRYFVALPIDLLAGDMDPGPQGGRKLVSAHTRWAKSAREWEEAAAVLPDRASRIIGTAAGAVLGLPVTDFVASRPGAGALVVAYDLGATDPAAATALRRRVPGQVLFERATCWTGPPGVTADVCGLLGQVVVPPWEPQLEQREDGTSGYGPADDRKAGEIAAEIAAAGFEPGGTCQSIWNIKRQKLGLLCPPVTRWSAAAG
jgi:hypothetical protein